MGWDKQTQDFPPGDRSSCPGKSMLVVLREVVILTDQSTGAQFLNKIKRGANMFFPAICNLLLSS